MISWSFATCLVVLQLIAVVSRGDATSEDRTTFTLVSKYPIEEVVALDGSSNQSRVLYPDGECIVKNASTHECIAPVLVDEKTIHACPVYEWVCSHFATSLSRPVAGIIEFRYPKGGHPMTYVRYHVRSPSMCADYIRTGEAQWLHMLYNYATPAIKNVSVTLEYAVTACIPHALYD